MGPLSAVAIGIWLVLVGSTWITWITASPKFLGACALIAAALIVIDTFWFGSGARYAAWRGRGRPAP